MRAEIVACAITATPFCMISAYIIPLFYANCKRLYYIFFKKVR
nr:MAG TPA: hypothetical protein [Caudoviricetes sp.]